MNFNPFGCSTARSAGLAPFKISCPHIRGARGPKSGSTSFFTPQPPAPGFSHSYSALVYRQNRLFTTRSRNLISMRVGDAARHQHKNSGYGVCENIFSNSAISGGRSWVTIS